jgi:Metallo-peptidase family M12
MKKSLLLSSLVGLVALTAGGAWLAANAAPPMAMAPMQAPHVLLNVLPESAAPLPPQARNQLLLLHSSRGAGPIAIAKFAPEVLLQSKPGQSVAFHVEPNIAFEVRALSTEPAAGGGAIWRGEVPGARPDLPPGMATLIVQGGMVTGSIHAPNGDLYQVRPLPGGATAIVKFDYRAAPADEPDMMKLKAPPMMKPMAGAPGADMRPALNPALNPALLAQARMVAPVRPVYNVNLGAIYRCIPCILQPSDPVIDVLVAYTGSAQMAAGDINSLINLAVTETNDSFANSGVHARLRLVGTMPVNYDDSNKSFDQMVSDLATSPALGVVRNQRNAVRADIAVMIINNTAYCGMADAISATPDTAFAVVHYGCATGYYSFGHEIGHLLGARHDRFDDGTSTPFAFGHGFQHRAPSGGWRTIMSYRCGDGSCDPRLQYWSSPYVVHNGLPMGTAGFEDNAAVWNARAAIVAGFR